MIFKDILTTKNVVFILLLLILLKILPAVSDIVMLFFACFVLSCSLLPVVQQLDKKIKNRSLSTGIVISGAVILTLAFIMPIFMVTFEQISNFLQTLPAKINEVHSFINTFSFNGQHLSQYIDFQNIIGNSNDLAQSILSQSVNITVGFAQGIIVFIAVVTIMFYMLKDTVYMKNKFIEFFPEKIKAKAEDIINKIAAKVGGYVIATIISCTAIWLLIALILAVLRVEYSFSLGLIAGVLDIIPVVGPTIALTLIVLTAFKKGLIIVAVAIILFLGVQQLSNNVIRPIVFGKFMELHPLVIIAALLIGGKFGGLIGLIFAPAIAAIVTVLIDEIYLKTINKKK